MCILGRSGVGKSVSLQLIMGFLKADCGEVIVAGENITTMDEANLERIRKKVTMVFQNGALFDSLSVGENVAFPLRERRDLNEEQIFQVIRGHLADELEVDPDTISAQTRFKEDLEADSLDLYTLVQELEDSYGVRIPDEQAAQITTVGQAVEFVLSVTGGESHASAPASAGHDAE